MQMRKVVYASLMVGAAALMGAQVQAQAPAAPPAAGGTADGIPFDIPYGTHVNLETARKLVAAVEAEAVKHRWKFVITVVDTNGDLVHLARMDGVQVASVSISQGKAPHGSALSPRIAPFLQRFRNRPSLRRRRSIRRWSLRLADIPLVENGKLIGAIGCSGGTGDQDAAACKVGADMIK